MNNVSQRNTWKNFQLSTICGIEDLDAMVCSIASYNLVRLRNNVPWGA